MSSDAPPTKERERSAPFPWRPWLVDSGHCGPAAAIVGQVLSDIEPDFDADAESDQENPEARGLSGGWLGQSIAFEYAANCFSNARYYEHARLCLDRALRGSVRLSHDASLFTGVAGLGWWLACIENESAVTVAGLDDLDLLLRQWLEAKTRLPELIAGVSGIGVYALERYPRGLSAELIQTVVAHLKESASVLPNGVSWFTDPATLPEWQRTLCPSGHYNLSVSHGVAGILGFLTAVQATAASVENSAELLADGCRWMARSLTRTGTGRVVWPSWIELDGALHSTRQSWCYGSATIALVVLRAGRTLADNALCQLANSVGTDAAAEVIDSAEAIADTTVCHGAAGIAHVFGRLFSETGELAYRDAAVSAYARLIGLRDPGRGCAGFGTLTNDGWVRRPGFLMGGAGVAAVLAAAVSAVEPVWDRHLLLSTRTV